MRYLTKTRFTSAIDCASKLNYMDDASVDNQLKRDEFAIALAEGGHQVGALAKCLFANGIEIIADGHLAQAELTAEHLKSDEVVLFEAAFLVDRLFVRVDLLHKKGDVLRLYEVKAKSFDSRPGAVKFLGAKGQVLEEFKPYLYDAAFQRHVVRLAHPAANIVTHLTMPDKAKLNEDGIIRDLRVVRDNQKVVVEVGQKLRNGKAAHAILHSIEVDQLLDILCQEPLSVLGEQVAFLGAIQTMVDALDNPVRPIPSSACRACEFRLTPQGSAEGLRDGRKLCWSTAFGIDPQSLDSTVFDLYNFSAKRTETAIQNGHVKLTDVSREDIEVKEENGKITQTHRQWLQCVEAREDVAKPFLLKNQLKAKLAELRYPLHFVDFETARSPIPYHANRRPYQLEFFQYSQHTLLADGTLTHANEYIDLSDTGSPNVATVRALMSALCGNDGSVLHWWDYERTVLSDMKRQLTDANRNEVPDLDVLLAFLDSLLEGSRLVDLGRKIVHETVFLPGVKGSSSIKRFLPAVLKHAGQTAAKYSQPIYGAPGGIASRNFRNQAWVVQAADGAPADPYDLLGTRFNDEQLDQADFDEDTPVSNGGAAMIAYGLFQSGNLDAAASQRLRQQLLRYCELDTLAMAIALEGITELAN